ncbi:MAG: type II secretion system F family protein [Panacagrimonas sp.]
MSPQLFGLLISAGVLLLGAALLAAIYFFHSARVSARLQRRLSPESAVANDFEQAAGPQVLETLARSGKTIEGLVDTDNESAKLLVQAGWRGQHHRLMYYAAQVLAPLSLSALAIPLWIFGPEKFTAPTMILLAVFAGLMLGALLPRMILRNVAEGRRRRIKGEVPLFIHLLVLLFEAGLSTRQALASMVRDGGGVLPELGQEFQIALRQLEAGGEIDEVLKNLAAAMDVEDLSATLALLRQVDRYGGEVRDPLLETLKVIEERRTLDMREMVNLLSGRMTVVMVGFFFPALLIFIAGPAFLAIIVALRGVAE